MCALGVGLLVMGCHDGARRSTPVLVVVTGMAPVVELAKQDVRSLTPERGQEIRVVVDTESTAGGERVDNEANRAERLVDTPGLFALVGHLGSRGSLAAAPVYNHAEVVQLVPTATSHLLGDVGPWTFTLSPNDSVEGAALGRFAAEYLGARRVALFYVPDEYGMGLRVAVMRKLREHDVRVVDNVPVVAGADLEILLASFIRRSPPDLILSLCPVTQTGNLARIASQLQPGLRVLAGDAATSLSQLIEAAGQAADSIYVATFWIPPGTTDAGRKFTARYQAMTGQTPEAGDALIYDAIMLLATAATQRRYPARNDPTIPGGAGHQPAAVSRSDRADRLRHTSDFLSAHRPGAARRLGTGRVAMTSSVTSVPPTVSLSLRAILLLFVLGLMAYAAAITIYLSYAVTARARALGRSVQPLEYLFGDLTERVEGLQTTAGQTWKFAIAGKPVPPESAAAIRASATRHGGTASAASFAGLPPAISQSARENRRRRRAPRHDAARGRRPAGDWVASTRRDTATSSSIPCSPTWRAGSPMHGATPCRSSSQRNGSSLSPQPAPSGR